MLMLIGVTTNSSSGVVDYASFFPVFKEMETQDLILNLHGEAPSGNGVTVLNAEETFLPTLIELHRRFPKLRIILEHCTTAAAIKAVSACGPTVAGTITAHHLSLIVDDWAGDSFNYCKPVAKTTQDREALLRTAVSGNPKFFFGSDSAPHPASAKSGTGSDKSKHAAGVFTQPYVTQLVLDAFSQGIESGLLNPDDVSLPSIRGFLGENGRSFYREQLSEETIIIAPGTSTRIMNALKGKDGTVEVVLFRRGESTRQLWWK